jgi:ABC-type glycerol-3-phosphate transport system substrate-binding protein
VGFPEQGPKTWDEMTAIAQKVTRAPDVWGVAIPYNGSPTWQFMPWVYANGGQLFSDDGKKVLVNSPEAAGAFVLWNDLAQRHQVTPEGFRTKTMFNAGQLFIQGKLAMYHTGVGFLSQLADEAKDLSFGTAVLPIGPRGKKTGCAPGGEMLGMLPNNKYPADTWRVFEWMIGNEAQIEYLVAGRFGMPLLPPQFENRYFKEEPRFLPFKDAAQAATPTWTTKFQEIRTLMQQEYMAAIIGAKEPQAAIRDMASGIERELAKA